MPRRYVIWTSRSDDPERAILRDALAVVRASCSPELIVQHVTGKEAAPERVLVSATDAAISAIAASLGGNVKIEEDKIISSF